MLANTADLGNNATNVAEALPGISKHVPKSLSKLAQQTNYPLAAIVVAANVYHTPGQFIEADGSVGAKGAILATDGTQTFSGMFAGGEIAKDLGASAVTARGAVKVLGGGLIVGTAASYLVGNAIDNFNHAVQSHAEYTKLIATFVPDQDNNFFLQNAMKQLGEGKIPLPPGHPFEKFVVDGKVDVSKINLSDPKHIDGLQSAIEHRVAAAHSRRAELEPTIQLQHQSAAGEGVSHYSAQMRESDTLDIQRRRDDVALQELAMHRESIAAGKNPVIGLNANEKRQMLDLTKYFENVPPESVPYLNVRDHDAAMARFMELTEKSKLGLPPEKRDELQQNIAQMQEARREFADMVPAKYERYQLQVELGDRVQAYELLQQQSALSGGVPNGALAAHVANVTRMTQLLEALSPGRESQAIRTQMLMEAVQANAALVSAGGVDLIANPAEIMRYDGYGKNNTPIQPFQAEIPNGRVNGALQPRLVTNNSQEKSRLENAVLLLDPDKNGRVTSAEENAFRQMIGNDEFSNSLVNGIKEQGLLKFDGKTAPRNISPVASQSPSEKNDHTLFDALLTKDEAARKAVMKSRANHGSLDARQQEEQPKMQVISNREITSVRDISPK